jgi:predicted metal-dependent hydrolase
VSARYRPEYLDGLRLFNAGAFWEAHEALERVWAPLPRGAEEKSFYQGLILLAAAFHHRERAASAPARFAAPALRCYWSGLAKLERLPDSYLGLDLRGLRRAVRPCFEPLAAGADPSLLPPAPMLRVECSCESTS